MAIIASITALFIDESVFTIGQHKNKQKDNYWVWIGSGLVFAAAAVAIITFVRPQAAGSGIPQMKAIMAGVKLP